MTAKELRVGNILEYHGQQVIVLEIKRNSAEFGYFTDSIGFERLYTDSDFPKPIPLTEERLVELGAKTLSHKNILNSHIIDLGRNRILSVSVQVGNTCVWLCEVNPTNPKEITDLVCVFNQDYDGELFVHTIQNIYHSITGTELNETNFNTSKL
jgi:hypothetical protein